MLWAKNRFGLKKNSVKKKMLGQKKCWFQTKISLQKFRSEKNIMIGYNAISVQLKLQLPTGTELGNISNPTIQIFGYQ